MRLHQWASIAVAGALCIGASAAWCQTHAPSARKAAATARVDVTWTMLGSSPDNGGVVTYADRASIHRSGNIAHMWELWDFKSAHAFEDRPFRSVRNQYEYDCTRMRRRMLSTRGFDRHMGQGRLVASADDVMPWESIDAGSFFVDHWKAACARS